MKHIPRFYVDEALEKGDVVKLSIAQMHHAFSVLRMTEGDVLHLFNEEFGEWLARVDNRKNGLVVCDELLVEPREEKGPRLACCLINPSRFSMVLEKSTELGVCEIIPIVSQFSQYRTINKDKCIQTLISAAEQSCRLSIPKLFDIVSLADFIKNFPPKDTLLVGDTSANSKRLREVMAENCTFLVGPEGGFSEAEREIFSSCELIKTFYFGNNILRAETAAISFLSSWVEKFT